ncbi:Bug family tripartite tricarboxylate transporter substrate binding protein [Ideonella livida]|uniref:Tripartite tricarboxylate transporter substrate binding protein n=1 Tax=Ideonella livida TaxID=2707176 RepID=A0A7C9PFI6_9BURK|nr:tripartite tricarboxylate transporter substrate binding protein [Ideonella livida]NDY90331.1 tripartite tricarboxylate transporter substrate binding protein [Ideonella livida]
MRTIPVPGVRPSAPSRRQVCRQIGHRLVGGLGLLSGLGALSPARAQAWPEKPVRWVLSQPPGSGPDNVARLLTERLAKAWGQALVVDNKPGGQNTIGAQAAARAPADGHAFYFATTAALVTNSYLFKSLPYDPRKDFVPVAFVARSPFAVLVEVGSPLRSLADLVKAAQARPGQLKVATEGPRTFGGMIARLLAARLGLDLNLAAYASVGTASQDTLGGHVDLLVADLASTATLLRQGRLRALAVTTAQRVAGFEAVPPVADTVPGFDMGGWFCLVAPAGTPEAVVQRVNRDLNALLAEPAIAERIAAIGPVAAGGLDPAQVAQWLAQEHQRWAQATREIGVLPE